jgi:putative ABC transport system permease protein
MAVGIALAVQPHFARLMQRSLSVSDILSPIGLLLILGILLLLIVVSGAYPAFHLSRINLVFGLKGNTGPTGRKSKMSVASVLVQFSVTVFLITSLVIIRAQVKHLNDIPLGFQPEVGFGISGYNFGDRRRNTRVIEEDIRRRPFLKQMVFLLITQWAKGGCGQNISGFLEDRMGAHSLMSIGYNTGVCRGTMKFELLDWSGFFLEKENRIGDRCLLNELL